MLKIYRTKVNAIARKAVFVAALGLALTIIAGIIPGGAGVIEVFAATENPPTIRMGGHDPMTREEFVEWSNQRGIRHFNLDGGIYPVGIFFSWGNGQSFTYGELAGQTLHVTIREDVCAAPGNVRTTNRGVNDNNSPSVNEDADTGTIPQDSDNRSPVIFTDTSPILFLYDELTAMIKRVPNQSPLDTISDITLPNRRLTETELEAWIAEYNEMGGATAFELAVVREINRVREEYGLQPLALDPTLMMSARLKTQEFADLQYFGHYSPVHGSITLAARMLGFDGMRVMETITRAGSNTVPTFRTTPEGIVRGMLASTRGHREILLNPNIDRVGFGASFSPNSTGPSGNATHMFYFATKFGFSN